MKLNYFCQLTSNILSTEKSQKLIKRVENFNKDLKDINYRGMNEFGSGGMNTKIEAAKSCNLAGCNMIIANGLYINPINQIEIKNNCTWFLPKISKLQARKKWIISSISPKGEVIISFAPNARRILIRS